MAEVANLVEKWDVRLVERPLFLSVETGITENLVRERHALSMP